MQALRKDVLAALVEHYELVALVSKLFAKTSSRNDLVRKGAVAQAIADHLNTENSPRFRARVARAAKAAGFDRVTNHGGILKYRYMKCVP